MEPNKKRSFFERLTGSIRAVDESEDETPVAARTVKNNSKDKSQKPNWIETESQEAELAVDVYQTAREIVIQTMIAGVKPEDLDLTVARDMVAIHGKREENQNIDEENYFARELYWGKFGRSVLLPHEVEPEEVEATERHGLLTIRLQKVDKEKTNSIKIKSL